VCLFRWHKVLQRHLAWCGLYPFDRDILRVDGVFRRSIHKLHNQGETRVQQDDCWSLHLGQNQRVHSNCSDRSPNLLWIHVASDLGRRVILHLRLNLHGCDHNSDGEPHSQRYYASFQ